MSTPDMTLGELARRMDAVFQEVRQGRQEMQEHVRRLEAEFIRKSEFVALQAADVMQFQGLESEVHSTTKRLESNEKDYRELIKSLDGRLEKAEERQRTTRMWLISAFVAPVFVMVMGALLLRGVV